MPRVLIAFEPPDGGVAEHVLHLALGLGGHGWAVEVAGPPQATIYSRLAEAGVRVSRIDMRRGFGRPWRDASAFRQLGALMRGGRFDLAHCHAAKAGALGRPVARLTGVPVVYTPHCFGFVGEVGVARPAVVTAERALGRITDALVCVCDTELGIAAERGICDPSRRKRIYNASEDCDSKLEPPSILRRWQQRGPVAGTIAVLRRQKRIDVLLDGATRVLAEVPSASLAIIGDGPLRSALHKRAEKLGLSDQPRFAFLPFEPPSARYLRALDVFVLSSSWEAFPVSVLEALACGVPQVATDVGGVHEAVSDRTGVLVRPDSPDLLADSLVALLRSESRRRSMAGASVERHDRLFRIERMVSETAALYEATMRGA